MIKQLKNKLFPNFAPLTQTELDQVNDFALSLIKQRMKNEAMESAKKVVDELQLKLNDAMKALNKLENS